MRNPVIPAHRLLDRDTCTLAFRCPWCGGAHAHGCGNGRSVQWRGSHCALPEIAGRNYRLLAVGEVTSARMLPRLTLADIAELNRALAPCSAQL